MPPAKSKSDTPNSAPDLEIVGDHVTLHPAGFTAGPKSQDEDTERNLVQNMARFRENPFHFLREISLFVSGTGWRAYDDIIGQPIYYQGFSDNMKANIMANSLLQGKMSELAEARLDVEEKEGLLGTDSSKTLEKSRSTRKVEIIANLQEVVDTMTDNMICKMESKSFIRGAYYLATQLLTRAYHQGESAYAWFKAQILPSIECILNDNSCRNPCLKRGSSPFEICGSGGFQEEAIPYFLALPPVSRRLCFNAAHMLPPWDGSSCGCSR